MDTINVSGVTYYKLDSRYSGDTTKNCGLIGSEIDRNFFNLRGHDIESVSISGNNLVFKRLNGSEFSVDLLPELTIDDLHFTYEKENGTINVEYSDGTVDVISGFTINPLSEIYTDNTLDGKGTINEPLRVNRIEETGSYSPADKYVELSPGETLEATGNTPGDRIVTKETTDKLGRLYSKDGLEILSDYLSENNSDWRIASKYDWDLLLNGLELDGNKNHSALTIGFLGKDAAQPLKSDELWKFNDNPIQEDGTCGFDVVGFNILPVGSDADGNKVSEGFNDESTLWTSTITEDGNYVKQFVYNDNRVGQNIVEDGFYAIRLVKDYDGNNYKGVEGIFNQSYPTILIPETNQIWTTINVYATKKEILDLSKNVNFIEVNTNGGDFSNAEPKYYINEWNGNEWIKKELKEGDSIVIIQKDIDDGITRYYRRWLIKDGELQSFEDYVEETFIRLETDFNNAITSARTDFENGIASARTDFEARITETVNNFNNIISTLSGTLSTQIAALDSRLETFINDELEGTIKYTVKQYIEDTTNEIKITETDDGKLKIGFSDDAIFG